MDLKNLTPSERAEIAELLDLKEKARLENQLEYWKPYPSQLEFIAASKDFPEIGLNAGNQRGKTHTSTSMVAAFATGKYPSWWPGRRFEKSTDGWVCGESREAVRDAAQLKLLGIPGDSSHVGLIPPNLIVDRALSHGATGAYDFVTVRHVNGGLSRITFKSYDQLVAKWQGPTLDYVLCDEEPPLSHYQEASARLIATNGLLFSTFTPLNGTRLILGRFKERTPDALRYRRLINMDYREAKHITAEMEAAIRSKYPQSEWRSRIEGYHVQGSGQVFEGVDLQAIIAPCRYVPGSGYTPSKVMHDDLGELETRHWAKLICLDFGIGHYFGATLLGWDRDRDIVYVMAEVKIRGGTPADHVSRMRSVFGAHVVSTIPCAWPHDGNQREKGTGEQLQQFYKREGLQMRPTHATFATGGYDTEAGVLDKYTRMKTGRLFIFLNCTEWMTEFEGYHRQDGLLVKEDDDLLSATRVGIMDLRFAKTEGTDPRQAARQRQPEQDIWGNDIPGTGDPQDPSYVREWGS